MDIAALLQSTLVDWATVSGDFETVPVLVEWVGLEMGTLLGVLVVGIFTAIIGGYWGLRTSRGNQPTERHEGERAAIETLKDRYVNGDVDAVEFEQRLETLYEDSENRGGDSTMTADSTRDAPSDGALSNVAATDRTVADQTQPKKPRGCGPGRGSKRRSKNRGCR
jgi:uncharacterized membrane protein